MIVVAYNPTFLSKDEYVREAAKARNAIKAPSVSKLAENIGIYNDHSIDTLIIADHGAEGIQGVGSGQTADVSVGTNLSAEYIKVSTVTVSGEPGVGGFGTGPEPMMGHLMKLARTGFSSRNQSDYIDRIARKIKYGGVLMLSGCSVGSGDEGEKLLSSLGLAVQNSISVIASIFPTSWTDTTKPIIYPARHQPHRRLIPSDVIGFMGMRPLSWDELDRALNKTDILAAN